MHDKKFPLILMQEWSEYPTVIGTAIVQKNVNNFLSHASTKAKYNQ